jgi:signal recognition particle subunit SRP54
VLYDSAGRLAIDEEMMGELEQLKSRVEPENILLVADSMIGQDAVKTAVEYDRRLGLSGFVLTKLDGDARGGAALSIKEVTGKPIKFIGMGEAMDKLEEFRPEGLASCILGLGDIVGLMKDFEGVVDEKKAEEKIPTAFLHDFVEQQVGEEDGQRQRAAEKFPGARRGHVRRQGAAPVEAIISSMTQTERKNPR